MKDLMELLEEKGGKIKLEITGADLMSFANELIRKAKTELAGDLISKQKYLTKSEVQELFGVSLTTLWNWNNKGYLRTIKVGRKILYRMEDIKKILEK